MSHENSYGSLENTQANISKSRYSLKMATKELYAGQTVGLG